MEQQNEIESFFGVYCLYNINPQFKGRTYIGFTVNPNRRVKQHNQGSHAGGAHKTSGRGPWEMVVIIHGFPNNTSALQFEWAWQNPDKSLRLKQMPGIGRKKPKETGFDHKFRILSHMLRTRPWCRLPLTVRWLKQEYRKEFTPELLPPTHMPMAFGLVKAVKAKKAQDTNNDSEDDLPDLGIKERCKICKKVIQIEDNLIQCLVADCKKRYHTLCLSAVFLKGEEDDELMPVDGECPQCQTRLLWGDLIKYKNGCYQDLQLNNSGELDDEDHWACELATQV